MERDITERDMAPMNIWMPTLYLLILKMRATRTRRMARMNPKPLDPAEAASGSGHAVERNGVRVYNRVLAGREGPGDV